MLAPSPRPRRMTDTLRQLGQLLAHKRGLDQTVPQLPVDQRPAVLNRIAAAKADYNKLLNMFAADEAWTGAEAGKPFAQRCTCAAGSRSASAVVAQPPCSHPKQLSATYYHACMHAAAAELTCTTQHTSTH